MERLHSVGEFLKRNKDIIQPLTTVILCILVALLYLFPGRTQTITIVQPPTTQGTGTGTQPAPTPTTKDSGTATSGLLPSDIYTNSITPDALDQKPSNSQTPSGGSTGSSGGGSSPGGGSTTPTNPTPKPVTCDTVTSGGGLLAITYDKSALYRGDRFTVTLSTGSTIPLGSVLLATTGNFLASPSTLNSSSTTTSFIAQYEGGYVPGVDPMPSDAITITSRCGGATFTGAITLQ